MIIPFNSEWNENKLFRQEALCSSLSRDLQYQQDEYVKSILGKEGHTEEHFELIGQMPSEKIHKIRLMFFSQTHWWILLKQNGLQRQQAHPAVVIYFFTSFSYEHLDIPL